MAALEGADRFPDYAGKAGKAAKWFFVIALAAAARKAGLKF